MVLVYTGTMAKHPRSVYVVVETWSSEWSPEVAETTIWYAGTSKKKAVERLKKGANTRCSEGSQRVECKRYGGTDDWTSPYSLRADDGSWRLSE